MAELTVFGYRTGTSLLHILDSRFKLACLILISLASLKAYIPGLSLLILLLVFAIIHIRVSFISVLKEIQYFLILLTFVLIARALSTPGTPVIEFMGLTMTSQGLYDGILVCGRLGTVVLLGLIFVSTTRPSEIKAAVEWFLTPFPFIPAKRVATMISLVMRFIPTILNQAKETADAQRARGIENRKNPVYRLIKFTIPLMRRTFEDADKLIVAMEARCYSENRTDPELSSGKKDWIALLLVICLCILIL
ncbi:energy-coupling factor transporter transmembrane component T family protein [Desulfonema magnum]|uniref:ABC transporter, permease protein domain-containing protein n=1 Tax=Desulfonema magnum TaxID=45655 RepID=A0A975BM47_9BACT|nr:energy-coupling factor transporter transmembrane component T [Desulfonema magnum]QTA87519.1 ABC transporter, permease protein domain-containing protein [Desulfonema magnum]